ncbi:MAG: TRAP transporter small permease subunit [Chloroflexota bacterium]
MAEAVPAMPKLVRVVDTVNEYAGRTVSWTIAVMMLIQVMECILRYIFKSPTFWAWETNEQIFIAMISLSGGYALLYNMHVRLDLVFSRLSKRTQIIVDIVLFPLVVLFLAVLVWAGGQMAAYSLRFGERSDSIFAPPLSPIKVTFEVGVVLLLLQAIAHFARNIVTLKYGLKKA